MAISVRDSINTSCLVILALVAITISLIYTKPVMVPFIFACLVTHISLPLVRIGESKLKMKRIVAVGCTLLLVVLVLAALTAMIAGTVKGAMQNLDVYQARIQTLTQSALTFATKLGIASGEGFASQSFELPYMGIVKSTVGTLGDIVGNTTLVTIIVLFMLTGRNLGVPAHGIWGEIDKQIRIYLVTKSVASLATGTLTAIILGIIGVDMAVMFGVLAFILNFIPTIGSIVALLLPLPVALLQFDSVLPIALALALPGVVQFLIGNVLEPKIMGDSLDLHPVTVTLALLFWGLVWGVPGMILATPVVVIVKIFLDRFEGGKVYANILAGKLPGTNWS